MSDLVIMEEVYSMNITKKDAFNTFRKFKDSKVEPSVKLKGSHQLLARYILNFFIDSWNKRSEAQRKAGFFIKTNNTSLAKLCDCTPRTIRNQVLRLCEAKILLNSELTGRGICIWLNPNVIFDFSGSDLKKNQGLVLEPFRVKNKIASVDNSEMGAARMWSRNDKNVFKNIEGHHDSRAALSGGGGPGMGSLSEYVGKFWTSAKDRLYPGMRFPDSREKVLIDLIASRFHMRQAESDKSPFDIYYKQMTYLDLASTWFKSHPEVIPPDPYHYFSSGLSGFRFDKIEEWEKQKQVSVSMRKSRIKIQVEAAQTKRLDFEDKVSIIGVHSNAIRAMRSQRLDKWFVQEYPKFLQP